MTTSTDPIPVTDIRRISRGDDAAEQATAAYDALLALLDDLDEEEAMLPTDCDAWDVGDVVAHLVGAAAGHASVRELLRQLRYGQSHAGDFDGSSLDAMNDRQVRDHGHLSLREKTDLLRELAPRAVRRRTRLPRFLRWLPVPLDTTGSMPAGLATSVTLGHLQEVVLTRDVFLHRIDLARATGRSLPLDETDQRIVADVVAEWMANHGKPVELHLTGPAGGRYRQDTGGATIDLDAVQFCRVVSGRAPGEGLLATAVLF